MRNSSFHPIHLREVLSSFEQRIFIFFIKNKDFRTFLQIMKMLILVYFILNRILFPAVAVWTSIFPILYMEAPSGLNLELVLGQPIPDGDDVDLDLTLAPPKVDDRPAPPLVGSQQAPVVADVFPERGELDSIVERLPKRELDSIVERASIPHPRGEFSAEQQAALNDRAMAHFYHKVKIIELMQSIYPEDEWENSRSIRERIFVGRRGDDEIDLDKLQQILCDLEKKRKKGLIFVFDQRTESTKTNLEFGTGRARGDKVGKGRDEVD